MRLRRAVMRSYDAAMRTTVDLPPELKLRVEELADEEGASMSATLCRLVAERMDQMDRPSRVRIDPVSGFPTVSIGRPITLAEVADLIDEDM